MPAFVSSMSHLDEPKQTKSLREIYESLYNEQPSYNNTSSLEILEQHDELDIVSNISLESFDSMLSGM